MLTCAEWQKGDPHRFSPAEGGRDSAGKLLSLSPSPELCAFHLTDVRYMMLAMGLRAPLLTSSWPSAFALTWDVGRAFAQLLTENTSLLVVAGTDSQYFLPFLSLLPISSQAAPLSSVVVLLAIAIAEAAPLCLTPAQFHFQQGPVPTTTADVWRSPTCRAPSVSLSTSLAVSWHPMHFSLSPSHRQTFKHSKARPCRTYHSCRGNL